MSYDFVQHGQELVDAQQYQEAVKICRLGLLAHPTAIAGRLVLGTALMSLRRYDEVLAEMRVALEIDGSNPRALALKGEALMYKGDPMQAAEVIEHALVYAPDDRKLRNLMHHVEVLLATTDPSEYARLDHGTMTKNYPVHRGDEDDDYDDDDYDVLTNDGNSITRPRNPGDAFRRPGDGPRGGGQNIGGTMDIDPYDEGFEVPNFAGPPGADDSMIMTRAIDTNSMGGRARINYDDLDDDLGPLAPPPERNRTNIAPNTLRPQNFSSNGGADATAHYRKAPDRDRSAPVRLPDRDRSGPARLPNRDRSGPAHLPARPSELSRRPPPSELASRHDREVALRRTQVGRKNNPGPPPALPKPPIDVLFDNDEAGGVSRMLLDSERPMLAGGGVARAVKQVRKPNQPTLAISGAERAAAGVDAAPPPRPPPPGVSPGRGAGPSPALPPIAIPGANPALPPSLGGDMQRLRGGPPAAPAESEPGLLESIVELDVENSPYAFPKAAPPQAAAPPPTAAPPPPAPAPAPASKPVARAAPNDLTAAMPKKRSPLVYALYAIIALAVVAGGVFAGFKIREIRLDRQIRNTERDAATFARADTFDGYSRARAAYARIVSVRATQATRSALARMDAALAAEFGENYQRASDTVGALSSAENADIAVARAYLALARGDTKTAIDLSDKLSEAYPDEPLGPYIRGRAALTVRDIEGAVTAFEKASELDSRPITELGRGRGYVAKAEYDRAERVFDSVLDMVPGHPGAITERAWITVARGKAGDNVEDINADLQTIADGKVQDGPARPSRRQQARAALTLASIEVMRGKTEDAKKALAQVAELMPADDQQFSVDLTTALLDAGEDEAAAKETERALKQWPDELPVRIAAARAAIRQGKPERAVELLNEDISGDAQALTTRGLAFLDIGLLEKAAGDLERAYKLNPKRTETLLALARTDIGTGDAEMAVTRLKPIYGEDTRPDIAVVYAAALRDNGDFKEAKTILERLVTLPRSGQAKLELARLERKQGRYKAAKAAYKSALKALDGRADVKLEAALLSFDIGEIKRANESLQALLKEAPQNPQVLLEAARVATLTGDFEQAGPLIDAADKLPAAARWQVARERIRLATRRKKYSEALAASGAILKDLSDEDEEIWLLIMELQLRQEDIESARETNQAIFKKFAKGTPVRFMARARLAAFEERTKDALSGYSKASKALKKLRASPRRKAEVSYWRGRVYYDADKLPEASRAFGNAVDSDPGHAEAYFFLGLVEMGRKRWKTAEKAFRGALAVDPISIPESRYFVGEVLYNQKRWGPAKRAFQEYLDKNPRGDFASDAKGYLKRLR